MRHQTTHEIDSVACGVAHKDNNQCTWCLTCNDWVKTKEMTVSSKPSVVLMWDKDQEPDGEWFSLSNEVGGTTYFRHARNDDKFKADLRSQFLDAMKVFMDVPEGETALDSFQRMMKYIDLLADIAVGDVDE